MRALMTGIAVAALACGVASADSIDLNYTGLVGGSGATNLKIAGQDAVKAGHMTHVIQSGANAGSSFNTFCIEIAEGATTGSATYEIVDLADAPNPGVPYGQATADAVNAVVANAVALGWIDNQLQADASQDFHLGKMGAIQAAIWEVLGESIDVFNRDTSGELAYFYSVLTDSQTFDDSLRINGLRAAVADGQQDILYIVPLPPAALAGLGMLGVVGGIRVMRRRG